MSIPTHSELGLKQFRAEGCLSYALFDSAAAAGSREAILVDPNLDLIDDYREFFAERGLRLRWTVDTHIHADHYSATHLLKRDLGGEIAMSSRTASGRAGRKLIEGDQLEFGRFALQALETPGHTPDSICLYGHGLLFTGDTLLIGGSGRTDFPGSDPGLQWDSLRRLLDQLPPSTVVLPGHDYSQLLFSTLEVERQRNAHLTLRSRDEFVQLKRSEAIPHPTGARLADPIQRRVDFNLALAPPELEKGSNFGGAATACGAPVATSSGVASINVEKFRHKAGSAPNEAYIDVREASEFVDGHIPGTRNIPLAELAFHLPELAQVTKVYVSCLSGFRSGLASRTLDYLGIAHVVNVSGGFKAWQQAGFPVET